jgi:hypothetical protein
METALSRSAVPIHRVILLVLAFAGCQGASEGGAGAPLPTAQERLDEWAALPEGTSVPVALGFGQPLPDSVVAGLLDRHSLRPYAAYTKAADLIGSQARERSRASLEVLAEAREQAIAELRTSLCAQQGRAREMLERQAGPDDPLDGARPLLSSFLAMRDALPQLELGGALIYGVAAVGTLADVRAAGSDPALTSYEPGWQARVERVDTVIVPDPPIPGGGTAGLDPVIAALPQEQLAARLRELAETGMGSCEDASGSVEER